MKPRKEISGRYEKHGELRKSCEGITRCHKKHGEVRKGEGI